mgnify:CR=1 FL=1
MHVGLLVEIIAVLADVLELGEYGGVVAAPAVLRQPAVPLTTPQYDTLQDKGTYV